MGNIARFRRTATKADAPKAKVGVLIAVASLNGYVRWSIAQQFARAIQYNHDPECPFVFEQYIINGARPVEFARNQAAEHFLHNTKCEWLMFWDSDQEIPNNWPEQIMISDCDIVSGTTFCWVGNDNAGSRLRFNQYSIDEKGQCFNILPYSTTQPYRVPIVGTACMAIHRHVIEAMGCWPFKVNQFPNGRYRAGEDVTFCDEARKRGFITAVHPGVVYGHVKELDLLQVAQFVSARMSKATCDLPSEVLSV